MTQVNKPNSLTMLWELYQQASTKQFPLSDVYLQLPSAKLDEIRNGFGASPVTSLPQISIL